MDPDRISNISKPILLWYRWGGGMGGVGGSVISTEFSRPGGSHSSPPSAHPLLPPTPHAPNSPRACLSLTARAKYLAEQAPAVLSPLCLLPIFPGGSADAARDGKGPEPRACWTSKGEKRQETLSQQNPQCLALSTGDRGGYFKQTSLSGWQLLTSRLLLQPPRRPSQGFPILLGQ